MPEPKLTIVIPAHNRPDLLPRALNSCLRQTVPAKIVVSDDGDHGETRRVLEGEFAEPLSTGLIRHLPTHGSGAWRNWRTGALAADTEFVAWLQHDDEISPRYSERILYGFSEAERLGANPSVWMACLDCADSSGRFGLHYAFNGPYVPMHTLFGVCEPIHYKQGACLAASSYFTSWSLSPALAYRNGPRFRDVLNAIPDACDIFIERIVPATMAMEGGFIADPAVVGLWIQHGNALDDGNLSRQQWADQPRQTKLLIPYLDDLLDKTPGWEEQFAAWCGVIPPGLLIPWMGQLDTTEKEGGKSRHGVTLRRLMLESLDGRIRRVAGPQPTGWRAWSAKLKSLGLRVLFRDLPAQAAR